LSTPVRIAFAGTPEFAVPALRALAASGAQVPLVLTQPDRPAGRGRRLAPSPVKAASLELGIDVLQPPSLRAPDVPAGLGPAPDLLVVVAYGLLLPRSVLAWPRLGCVNVHASLLPRWRGAAPIQHALLAGDSTTGVSLMRMDEGLDTGPVYAMRDTPVGAADTAADLHDRLAALGAQLLADALPALLAGELRAQPQRPELATLAPKIMKADAALDWRRPAVELERRVRAFNPWPVAEAALDDGRRLRVWQAAVGDAESEPRAAPGTILGAGARGIDVATGAGVLRLERVQPPSARAMDAAAYLAAHSVAGAAFVS
jgi:methionyl-tRNA formyltransferase